MVVLSAIAGIGLLLCFIDGQPVSAGKDFLGPLAARRANVLVYSVPLVLSYSFLQSALCLRRDFCIRAELHEDSGGYSKSYRRADDDVSHSALPASDNVTVL
jgi:hypothetical protein